MAVPLQGQAVPWLVPSGHLSIAVAEGLGGFSLSVHLFVRFPSALVGTDRAVYPPLEVVLSGPALGVGLHRGGALGY